MDLLVKKDLNKSLIILKNVNMLKINIIFPMIQNILFYQDIILHLTKQ